MVKVKSQDIPSEDAFKYSSSLRQAVNHPTLGRKYGTFKYGEEKYGATLQAVQQRYPFRQPYKQNSSPHSPTAAQRATRDIFTKCRNCFKAQPKSGGATPPALGPRNREFWYTSSGGSGLFYYDYFMQQTLSTWFGVDSPAKYPFTPVVPDWCKAITDADSTVVNTSPNSNFGSETHIEARHTQIVDGPLHIAYGLVSSPVVGYSSLVLKARIIISQFPLGKVTLKVYKITQPWGELTVTWNNQPDISDEIGSVELTDTSPLFPEITIPLSGDAVNGIMFRVIPDPIPTVSTISFLARSLQYAVAADRPKFLFQ